MNQEKQAKALEELKQLVPNLTDVLEALVKLGKENPALFEMALKFIKNSK